MYKKIQPKQPYYTLIICIGKVFIDCSHTGTFSTAHLHMKLMQVEELHKCLTGRRCIVKNKKLSERRTRKYANMHTQEAKNILLSFLLKKVTYDRKPW